MDKSKVDELKEGQDVSWKWGTSQPTGKVAEIVEEGKAQVTSNKGNTVTRNAREGDPAVKIARDGVSAVDVNVLYAVDDVVQNDVVKLAHELSEVKET